MTTGQQHQALNIKYSPIGIFTYVYMHVNFMGVYVEEKNTGIPVCLGWRPALSVFFTLSWPQILRSHLSLNLEITNLARLAGQKDLGILLFSLPLRWSIGYFVWLVGIQTQDLILAYQMLCHLRHFTRPWLYTFTNHRKLLELKRNLTLDLFDY